MASRAVSSSLGAQRSFSQLPPSVPPPSLSPPSLQNNITPLLRVGPAAAGLQDSSLHRSPGRSWRVLEGPGESWRVLDVQAVGALWAGCSRGWKPSLVVSVTVSQSYYSQRSCLFLSCKDVIFTLSLRRAAEGAGHHV